MVGPKTPAVKRTKKSSRLIGVRIDIESKSRTDVKYGAYRYAEDPEFAVLLLAYSPIREFEGGTRKIGTPRLLDLEDSVECARFQKLLLDPRFEKDAFNANFERITLSKWMGMPNGTYLDPENWRCSAIQANVNGVFGTLDEVARAVYSPIAKDSEGKRLIRLFSIPDRKTKKFHRFVREGEPFEGRHCWCGIDHAEDSLKFGEYCCQDVMTEAGVAVLLPAVPDDVQEQYEADQRINDRGFRHFSGLSKAAIAQVEVEKDRLMGELKRMTGLDNPNSVQQFRGWLDTQGYPMASLAKAKREEALDDPLIPDEVAEALELKGAASLSSVTKHKAALDTRCSDGRIRGSLRFYGAHTGREAGRGIQPQNLPRYEAPPADRALLLRGLAGREAPRIAKGTVRASIVPARGNVFVTFDYNAIEARCLGWQAGEQWVQDEFTTGPGKIYEATAEKMFGVPKDDIIKARALCDECSKCFYCETRGKGKVAELGLGYAGGAGALVTMGAEDNGMDIGNYKILHMEWEERGRPGKFYEWERDRHDYPELIRYRDLYRDARPMTVRFWKLCAKAWDVAATTGKGARFGPDNSIVMMRDGKHNRLVLPSGRSIWYRHAKSHPDPNGRVSQDGQPIIDRRTFMGKGMGVGHIRTDTHGGKLTENITQAIARDALFDLIMKIEAMTAAGWPGRIVLHVHDEVVLETTTQHADQVYADVAGLMSTPPDWAPGLAVKGAGTIMDRYGK